MAGPRAPACGPPRRHDRAGSSKLVELVHEGIQAAGLPMPFLRAWHEEAFAPGSPEGFPMRRLVVGFAFDELGAERCESGYVVGNHASAAVSRKVGYVENGRRRIVQHTRHGKVGVDEQRMIVTPATFVRPDGDVSVQGADVLCRFLGIDPGPADS